MRCKLNIYFMAEQFYQIVSGYINNKLAWDEH